jgi:hypothetical protein
VKELISPEQAAWLMRIVLVLAPLIGLAWGVTAKKVKLGVLVGIAIGGGNFILWHVYNAITDRLGLDTVLNFEVNLGLFVFLGIVIGVVVGLARRKSEAVPDNQSE